MAVSTLASTPALATRRFDPLRRPAARARVTVRRSCITAARAPDSNTRDTPQNRAAAVLLAALVAASPLVSPPDADAARSSGRVGGSSFRSSSGGAGRSYSAPRASANVYVAPPLGGYGYGGYGYGMGGMALAPSVVIGPSVGFGFGFGSLFSGLFQLTIVAIVLNTLLSFASNISKGAGRGEDDEDTL